jgi:hypothetical protein
MRVIFDHLRPPGRIMLDMQRDRGWSIQKTKALDHLHIKQLRTFASYESMGRRFHPLLGHRSIMVRQAIHVLHDALFRSEAARCPDRSETHPARLQAPCIAACAPSAHARPRFGHANTCITQQAGALRRTLTTISSVDQANIADDLAVTDRIDNREPTGSQLRRRTALACLPPPLQP